MGRFGDVLHPVSRPEAVRPDGVYRTLGVQWYAKGPFVREEKAGHEIRAKELYRVEDGDFIYNRLFAWKGSFGIVESDMAGGHVSGEFPCFRVDTNRAEPRFLQYYLSQEWLWNEIGRRSSGQTNISRLRFKEPDFLAMELPLPPLGEQERIVERIEVLARRVEEARRLRRETVEEAEALIGAELGEVFDPERPLADPVAIEDSSLALNQTTRNPQRAFPDSEFLYVDIASVENGTGRILAPQRMRGSDAPSRARRVIHSGDVIMSTVRPNLRGFAVVPPELDNQICSTGFAVFSCQNEVDPRFLLYQLFSPFFLSQAEGAVTGGHYPALNDKALKSLQLMIPGLDVQKRIAAHVADLQAKVDELRRLQEETQKELDALMPSILAKAFAGEL